MFSTARKLSALSFILVVANIVGLIMVAMYFVSLRMDFHWMFACLMYLITMTVIALCLTISIRTFVQDSELESSSNATQIRKLKERIEELERHVK